MKVPSITTGEVELPNLPTNGATVVAAYRANQDEYVILCRWRGEWVTWRMNHDGDCYWGHYFTNMVHAVDDIFERVSKRPS